MNSLAHIPSSFIVAMGRPDINAKFHMAELIFHAPIAWLLIHRYGVTGAAMAWTIRVTVDAYILFLASARMLDTPFLKLFSVRPSLSPQAVQDSC
jgi:O-antigen/teichoic acid export membrane protein